MIERRNIGDMGGYKLTFPVSSGSMVISPSIVYKDGCYIYTRSENSGSIVGISAHLSAEELDELILTLQVVKASVHTG